MKNTGLVTPAVGQVQMGDLRRVTPISRLFGFERGYCIDRYYIEAFLSTNREDIKGYVLEIAESVYTQRFGDGRITRNEVLHVVPGTPGATIHADLTASDHGITPKIFDCIIFTQTLPHTQNPKAAVGTLFEILKPGGVVLATFPGLAQISRYDMDRWGDYWRFTDLSARTMFAEVFGEQAVAVHTHGNVLASVAYLHGLAAHELTKDELDHHDPDYQVVITVRAAKEHDR